jgi:hypothetical protein
MQNDKKRPARSVGKLHIGSPEYDRGVFTVDMVFESSSGAIGEDEIKSATLTVKQKFFELLHQNGFWDHGPPEVVIHDTSENMVRMIIAAKASNRRAPLIKINGGSKDTDGDAS